MTSDTPPPARDRSHSAAHQASLRGRKMADRRVHRARPATAQYFRYTGSGPDVVTARTAASLESSRLGRIAARWRRTLYGRPIATADEAGERLTKVKALAVFSSDALSSVAYATEALLFTLLIAGPAFFGVALPISILIVAILGLVTVSYRQTIRAYPNGGGSYIVAKTNLGTLPGLIAAAALLTDYVLTVSVSVAAGIANLASAFPGALGDFRVELSVLAILVIMVINMRGVRESGSVFAIPTYVFVGSVLVMLGAAAVQFLLGSPPVVTDVVANVSPLQGLGLLLLLRTFADGCSAMTGVEAISNGVPAFRKPEANNARQTLVAMSALLGVMFIGITILALNSGAVPSDNETIISQIARATFGGGSVPYFTLLISTFLILVLAANTAFSDFPRLASLLARDRFMPTRFAFRGERLAFSTGIAVLAALAAVVVVVFNARVEALIPLYAVGVFTSFTLSQFGMVRHWWVERGLSWRRSIVVNAVGGSATAVVAVIFAVAKFSLGAWVILIIIPVLVGLMAFVRREYRSGERDLAVSAEFVPGSRPSRGNRVVIPVAGLRRDVVAAVKLGSTMTDGQVIAVHVTDDLEESEALRARFAAALPGVRFVTIETPYRDLINPLIHWLRASADDERASRTIVILAEYVVRHWWGRLLYNQNTRLIRTALLGERDLVIVDLPFRSRPKDS